MKVTFPYMGPILAYKKLFELLGHEVVLPPRPTKRTIELGTKFSPESICFPFKIILGSYLEAIEQGADFIVTSGGIGACRAVYYGALSEKILHNLGFNVKVLFFDSIFDDFACFNSQLQIIKNGRTLRQLLAAFHFAVQLTLVLDKYEKAIHSLRPHEKSPGACTRKWQEIQELIGQSHCWKELTANKKMADRLLAEIELSPKETILRIGLVGEIYLVMESSMNNNLEAKLATMGVEVTRCKYISTWLKHVIFPPHKLLKKADPYLKYGIGGHEKENIGYMIHYKELGLDGIIHLMPFGCMPELVTQTIIPAISRDLDLPILSLSLDEQTGWGNNQIRLEAFIDLLHNRQETRGGARYEQRFLRH